MSLMKCVRRKWCAVGLSVSSPLVKKALRGLLDQMKEGKESMVTRKLSERIKAEVDQQGLRLHFQSPTARTDMTETLTIAEVYQLALYLQENSDLIADTHHAQQWWGSRREEG
jgi:hypothetical protein